MTSTQSVAGHPIAMKVGGRRLSVSKSPVPKSHLSTSPTATKDTGNSAAKEPADAKVSESALNPDYPVADPKDKDAALATADAYPRPQNGAAAGQEGGGEVHKDDAKKEEQPPKKEAKKQVFEDSKHAHINKNPHSVKNVPIKQPGGKM